MIGQRRSDRLDASVVDASPERLAGVGHDTPLEAPARFASAIRERLAGPTKTRA